ncbi:hypothetical protein [Halorhabdus utahensis]|nr:hypothetical protein [Halorhabdus utahensis]
MRVRILGYAAFAGIATFLVVFFAVSEALLPYIEFSVLVGIPVGLLVGTLSAAFVLTEFGSDTSQTRRALARGLGTAGIGFVVAFGIGLLTGQGVTLATVLGVATGLIAGMVIVIRETG